MTLEPKPHIPSPVVDPSLPSQRGDNPVESLSGAERAGIAVTRYAGGRVVDADFDETPEEAALGEALDLADIVQGMGNTKLEEIEDSLAKVRERLLQESTDVKDQPASKINLDSMLTHGYAQQAPRLATQLGDSSRSKLFIPYKSRAGATRTPDAPMTESEGLDQLADFLLETVEVTRSKEAQRKAESIAEALSFIGEPEYLEAVQGLANYWKHLLDSNPDLQLCILTEVGRLERYREKPGQKSDIGVRSDILATFSDAELAHYSGRIVGSLDDVTSQPEDTKIILVDDWSISGKQMRDVCRELLHVPLFLSRAIAGEVEIDLLAASKPHLRNGLLLPGSGIGHIPVRSFFRAFSAQGVFHNAKVHLTGLHSTVNWGFKDPIIDLSKITKKNRPVPSLARIQGPHELLDSTDPGKVRISHDKLERVADEGKNDSSNG